MIDVWDVVVVLVNFLVCMIVMAYQNGIKIRSYEFQMHHYQGLIGELLESNNELIASFPKESVAPAPTPDEEWMATHQGETKGYFDDLIKKVNKT